MKKIREWEEGKKQKKEWDRVTERQRGRESNERERKRKKRKEGQGDEMLYRRKKMKE